MERLVVKNFLLLQDVNIEIKKYNFLLGPQASGKIVLAKLLYFVYQIPSIMRNSIRDGKYSEEILDSIRERFKEIFPENYWASATFSIFYQIGDLNIRLENKENKLKTLSIIFNKPFDKIISEILDIVRISDQKLKNKDILDIVEVKSKKNDDNIDRLLSIVAEHPSLASFFKKSASIFIPSSRCVYSILADKPATNSATFSSDFILNQFGQLYENIKDLYNHLTESNDLGKEFRLRSESLLKGKYVHEKKQDYITINNKKINVKYVSSGQQEILPLLIILGIFSSIAYDSKNSHLFFIEEPEAHLFPEAQVQIMSLLSLIGYESKIPFFITTHSPYLLSVLNNYLYGTRLLDEKKITLDQYNSITNGARPIRTDEVNAFTLENGNSISVMDEDGVFIDSKTLDKASSLINDMYDTFIDQILEV